MSSVKGWFCWQEPANNYEIGTDAEVVQSGKRSGYVASKSETGSFGAIMQKINAKHYCGKRVRFSAFVKCETVKRRCGLFMEIFSNRRDISSSLLAVDNMHSRPLSGDRDWEQYSIVLDAPEDAFGINIGARVIGPGKMWIDGVTLEVVGDDIPVTDELNFCQYPKEPQNLSFEDDT